MKPRTKALLAGMALILATNAIALGGAYYNRGGLPKGTLVLSERELTPPYAGASRDENSGMSLRLNWRVARFRLEDGDDYGAAFSGYGRQSAWLNAEKLAALGFDVSISLDAPDADRRYRRQRTHDALLVLEFDGPTYAAALKHAQDQLARAELKAKPPAGDEASARNLERTRKNLDYEQTGASRLFVVDTGTDFTALRQKYADAAHYAIVAGRVDIGICDSGDHVRQLCGRVDGLAVASLNVPYELRPVFEGAVHSYNRDEPRVRYSAVVTWGQRLEPWLASAQRQ